MGQELTLDNGSIVNETVNICASPRWEYCAFQRGDVCVKKTRKPTVRDCFE